MQFIKTYKNSNNSRVSLMEFRYILVKFGIMLPMDVVENIFRIYDHDNSGSIDFDEFAAWIMNADYKKMDGGTRAKVQIPKVQRKPSVTPNEALRQKMLDSLSLYPQTFERLLKKESVGYMDFMGDVNRLGMTTLTERDVREIYLLLDPNDTGHVGVPLLKTWYETGVVGRPAYTLKRQARKDPPLGKKPLPPRSAKPLTSSITDSKNAHFRSSTYLRPVTNSEPLVEGERRQIGGIGSSVTSADRRLQDLLRKEFRLLKSSIERNANVDLLGYINSDLLYSLITRYCGTFSSADYRLVMLTLKTDESKTRVDYKHFLMKYDPENKINAQLEINEEHLRQASHMKKTMSIGSFCGFPTPR